MRRKKSRDLIDVQAQLAMYRVSGDPDDRDLVPELLREAVRLRKRPEYRHEPDWSEGTAWAETRPIVSVNG